MMPVTFSANETPSKGKRVKNEDEVEYTENWCPTNKLANDECYQGFRFGCQLNWRGKMSMSNRPCGLCAPSTVVEPINFSGDTDDHVRLQHCKEMTCNNSVQQHSRELLHIMSE